VQNKVLEESKLRIVFMGTPEFAVPSLKILIENDYNIVGVITSTDKMGGRGGKKLLQSAVKKYALSQELTILQPKNLKSKKFLTELSALKADLQIIIAFRMLPVVVWDMPRLGTYNLHGSLLPSYRGAAPINWAVINGEKETGVTSFKLKHEIDTGDILVSRKIDIDEEDTAGTLHDKMMIVAADAILASVKMIESEEVPLIIQDESKVSKAPKIFHQDCCLDFDRSVKTVYDLIRGLSPYPTSWMIFREKKLKVFWANYVIEKHTEKVSTVLTDERSFLHVYCRDGYLSLKEVQWEGRKKMNISQFLNGLN